MQRCVQLLWGLGRDDEESTPYTEGAFSVLVNMARYERYKSITFNLSVLTEVERINEAHDEQNHRHLPIEVIAPVLVKSFDSYEETGARLTIRRLPVAGESVAAVRRKALDILSSSLFGPPPRAAVKAIDYLVECLRHAEFGADKESERIWQRNKTGFSVSLLSSTSRILRGCCKQRSPPRFSGMRSSMLVPKCALKAKPSFRVSRVRRRSTGMPSLIPDVARSLPSTSVRATLEEQQVAIDALLVRVVGRVIARVEPANLLRRSGESLGQIDRAGLHGGAGWLMIDLANRDLAYAKRTAETIVSTFPSVLGDAIAPIITMTWQLDRP